MLNISIVLYKPKWKEEVNPLVEELKKVKCLRHLYLRDNTNDNIGYGRAHNIELRKSAYEQTEFHLVMNSDIRVKAEDIDAMHDFMLAAVSGQTSAFSPRCVRPSFPARMADRSAQ